MLPNSNTTLIDFKAYFWGIVNAFWINKNFCLYRLMKRAEVTLYSLGNSNASRLFYKIAFASRSND